MQQVSIKFGHKSIPDEINLEFNVMKNRNRKCPAGVHPVLFGGGGRKIEFTISDRKIRGDLNSICESNDECIAIGGFPLSKKISRWIEEFDNYKQRSRCE